MQHCSLALIIADMSSSEGETTMIVRTKKTSSPKEFFERLYGPSDASTANNNDEDPIIDVTDDPEDVIAAKTKNVS